MHAHGEGERVGIPSQLLHEPDLEQCHQLGLGVVWGWVYLDPLLLA